MISNLTIISMFFPVIFSFILFVGLILFFRNKIGISVKPIIIGGVGFFVITQVLEKLLHLVVITSFPNYADHPWLFGLYGGMAAGVFEELGRFLLFTWLLKKYRSYKDGVSFGIGWGGIEAVILNLLTVVPLIIFAFMMNAGTFEATIGSQMNSHQMELLRNSVLDHSVLDSFYIIIERLFAVFLQIALSILVLYAVLKKKFSYVVLAIFIHAAVDFPAVFYQTGHLTQLWIIEAYLAVIAFLSLIFIRKSKSWFK